LLSAVLPALGLLVLLLIAAAVVLWWARRNGGTFAGAGRARRVKLVERLVLSHGTALVLVEYDGRAILVGQSGDRLSILAGAPAEREGAP
jgi:uncharacterized iron-regulated membrane protein